MINEKKIFKALKLWKKLKAFYDEVFRYLSKRLQEYYNDDDQLVGFENESIPAYWLRSLTGTRFSAIADLIIPYRNESRTSSITFIDVIRFYETIGFNQLPTRFWKRSSITYDHFCHPITMNLITFDDVRMRICLREDGSEYDTNRLFHELGHVYYYYYRNNHTRRNLDKLEQNSIIHESVGETIRLFWSGCQQQNGNDSTQTYRSRINRLMNEFLYSFVVIPYGISLELWRHRIFYEMPTNVSVAEMNKEFWEIRSRIQRIENTSDDDDDLWSDHISALLKYHTVNFIPYLQYVFSTILMHRFHSEICRKSQKNWYFLADCCPNQEDLFEFR